MQFLAIIFALLTATSAQQQGKPPEAPIQIFQQSSEVNTDGSFRYSYKTENGINMAESGYLKNLGTPEEAQRVEGSYSYTAPDGTLISLTYSADDNGFNATGDHLPVAPTTPPIPYLIAKSLAYNAANAGVGRDTEYKTRASQKEILPSVSGFRGEVGASDGNNGISTTRKYSYIDDSDDSKDGSGGSGDDGDDSDDSDDSDGSDESGGKVGFSTGGAGF